MPIISMLTGHWHSHGDANVEGSRWQWIRGLALELSARAPTRPCPQIHTHRLVRDQDVCLFFVLVTPVELVDNLQNPLSDALFGSG